MIKLFSVLLGVPAVLLLVFYLGRWTAPEPQFISSGQFANADELPIQPQATTSQCQASRPAVAPQTANADEHPSYQQDLRQMQTLIALADTTPAAALEQISGLRGPLKTKARNAILAKWAATNPYAAWTWLETQEPANRTAFIALLTAMASSQPQSAMDYADRFAQANPAIKKDIYLATVKGLARDGDYESARLFIDYLDDQDAIKGPLINELANEWGLYEPRAALRWLMSQPQYLSEPAMGQLGRAWTEVDPRGATYFAMDNNSQWHTQLLTQAFAHWLSEDPAQATAWISAQSSSAQLDPLIGQLAQQPMEDPAELSQRLRLSGRISDPQLRLNTLLRLLSPVKQQDADAAKAYIAQLDFLTPQERQQLTSELALTN